MQALLLSIYNVDYNLDQTNRKLELNTKLKYVQMSVDVHDFFFLCVFVCQCLPGMHVELDKHIYHVQETNTERNYGNRNTNAKKTVKP